MIEVSSILEALPSCPQTSEHHTELLRSGYPFQESLPQRDGKGRHSRADQQIVNLSDIFVCVVQDAVPICLEALKASSHLLNVHLGEIDGLRNGLGVGRLDGKERQLQQGRKARDFAC